MIYILKIDGKFRISKTKETTILSIQTDTETTVQAYNLHQKVNLLLGGLEDESVLGLALEGHTLLKQLDIYLGELLEESIVVLGIALNVGLEALVLDQRNVGGQHHQCRGGLVGELSRAVPLALVPLLLDKEAEELIAEDSWAEVPRTVKARAIGVCPAQGVCADQSDHLAVVEAHTSEHVTDVALTLCGVRQTTVRGAGGNILVLTARAPGNLRAAELLDGGGAGQSPKIGVGDPGELGLDGLEEVTGVLETGIGAVV